ncbi:Vesicle trafficking protein Sly1 (Sec1 family) (ISS), partial [Corchorus capsularis]
ISQMPEPSDPGRHQLLCIGVGGGCLVAYMTLAEK